MMNLFRLLALTLIVTLGSIVAVPSAQANSVTRSSFGPTGVSREASAGQSLALATAYRHNDGRGALQSDRRLMRAAQDHANWMARNGVMSHQGDGGSKMVDRIRATGYRACFAAENVAMGQRSDRQVMQSWMDSPGHRRNILDRRAVQGAVATAVDGAGQTYWVMLLAKPC